jgi:hypothetical protein
MAVNLSQQYKTTSAPEKNSRGFAFVEMINTEETDQASLFCRGHKKGLNLPTEVPAVARAGPRVPDSACCFSQAE